VPLLEEDESLDPDSPPLCVPSAAVQAEPSAAIVQSMLSVAVRLESLLAAVVLSDAELEPYVVVVSEESVVEDVLPLA
jgi:hypothetical protein